MAQNGASTKLFQNVAAKPGLRVRILGSRGNVEGVGVAMRLFSATTNGPVREIHAGSGYRSQDSAVQVVAPLEAGSKLWLRWPGGRTNLVDVPPGSKEITVDQNGFVSE